MKYLNFTDRKRTDKWLCVEVQKFVTRVPHTTNVSIKKVLANGNYCLREGYSE